jgi:hypothetical protein
MQLEVDVANGLIGVTLTAIPETWQDVTFLFSEEQAVSLPMGKRYSPRSLSDLAETVAEQSAQSNLPALMGGNGSLSGAAVNTTYVRLYGDSNQVVLAQNQTYKEAWDRPVWVTKRSPTRGPGGSSVSYEIVGLRTDTYEQTEVDSRGYVIATGTFVVPGTLHATDSSHTIPSLLSNTYCALTLRRVKAYLKTSGDAATLTVSCNGTLLATLTIAAGASDESLDIDDVSIPAGSVLSLALTSVGSTPGRDLTVILDCIQYGV